MKKLAPCAPFYDIFLNTKKLQGASLLKNYAPTMPQVCPLWKIFAFAFEYRRTTV